MGRFRVVPNPRFGALLGIVAATCTLVACIPAAPPPPPPPFNSQFCAASAPSTPAAYQAAFNELRNGNTEWAAADGGGVTQLPDGRVLWSYGDTFTGRVQNGALEPGWRLPRNSLVVQSGNCFRPLMGGSADARSDLIPAPSGEWYWPTTGVVESSGSGNVLRMFVFHMTTGNEPGAFNFRLIDMRIATFTLPGLQLTGVQGIPSGIPSGESHAWGSSVLTVGSTVYVFGNGSGNPNDPDPLAGRTRRVARVALGSLTTAPWQFYNGGTTGTDADWSTTESSAAPMTFIADTPALPAGAPSVKPWDTLSVRPRPGGGFFAVGNLGELANPDDGVFGTEISEWTAPAPQGPWHYNGKIAQTAPDANQYTYGGRLEVGLPGSSPTVMYSINSFDDVTQNLSLYDVRFLVPTFPP